MKSWFRCRKEGLQLNIEPHSDDFVETLPPAVDMIRTTNSKNIRFLYCAPHIFHLGNDMELMICDSAQF
jgi:myo-inositol catabolism protein IolH